MQKTITRNTVIKALRTEPLHRGYFFDTQYGDSPKTCKVCAVGAVLRISGLVKGNESNVRLLNMGINATESLNKNNYLGALSKYFENVSSRRSDLVKFVKKNFPFYITFNV